jgi:hypothetical protein
MGNATGTDRAPVPAGRPSRGTLAAVAVGAVSDGFSGAPIPGHHYRFVVPMDDMIRTEFGWMPDGSVVRVKTPLSERRFDTLKAYLDWFGRAVPDLSVRG